jgi:hypothetical protein
VRKLSELKPPSLPPHCFTIAAVIAVAWAAVMFADRGLNAW